MTKMYAKIQTLIANQDGATAVEYALLVGLIAVAIIGAVTALGTQLSTLFTTVKNSITP
ncbi:MAG: Flp family type IVb pilin [Actinomycetes bacterium]